KLARGQAHDPGEIYGTESRVHQGNIEVITLLKDQHLGMIIEGERFFGGLVIDDDGAKPGVGFTHRDEIKPEPAFELPGLRHAVTPDDLLLRRAADQFAIVQRREWIALR